MTEKQITESFSKQSFLSTIGARLESVEAGQVAVSCSSRDDLKQHTGVLHAGVLCTIADVACGYAAMTRLPDYCSIVSVEFKVNLLRPVGGKKVVATGRVIKPGKTLMIAEADVVDDDTGKLVAKMLGTMMVTKGEA